MSLETPLKIRMLQHRLGIRHAQLPMVLQRIVFHVDLVELSDGMQPDQLSTDEVHRLLDEMLVMR